jgi:hypothetical protein
MVKNVIYPLVMEFYDYLKLFIFYPLLQDHKIKMLLIVGMYKNVLFAIHHSVHQIKVNLQGIILISLNMKLFYILTFYYNYCFRYFVIYSFFIFIEYFNAYYFYLSYKNLNIIFYCLFFLSFFLLL